MRSYSNSNRHMGHHSRSPFRHGYWSQPQEQQQPRLLQVIMVRPATGSRLLIEVVQGTPMEQILQDHPGWEFAEC